MRVLDHGSVAYNDIYQKKPISKPPQEDGRNCHPVFRCQASCSASPLVQEWFCSQGYELQVTAFILKVHLFVSRY